MILAGVGALLGSVAVFLGASEDVVRDNGAARLDSSRLNWFTQHRSVALVDASKFINTAAGLAAMIVLAALVGVFLWSASLHSNRSHSLRFSMRSS